MFNIDEIKDEILKYSNPNKIAFYKKITPGASEIHGVKTKDLHNIAKGIKDQIAFLEYKDFSSYELEIIYGDVICLLKDYTEVKKYIREFIPHIHDWAVLDNLCCRLKIDEAYLDDYYKFILEYKNSKEEFEIRFVCVSLLNLFIKDKYIKDMFILFDKLDTSKYYAMMALAWCLAELYPHYQDEVILYLKRNTLDKRVHNKALQKMIESNKINKDDKLKLKELKRK